MSANREDRVNNAAIFGSRLVGINKQTQTDESSICQMVPKLQIETVRSKGIQ